MTHVEVVRLLTEIVTLIGVLGAVIVNIIVALKTNKIHTLVNSNATIAQNKIESLTNEVNSLKNTLIESKKETVE